MSHDQEDAHYRSMMERELRRLANEAKAAADLREQLRLEREAHEATKATLQERADNQFAALQAEQEKSARLEEALRFCDPRNATERYDRIADDFHRETGLWPPGRSRPAAMGPDPDAERANRTWRTYVDAWHEHWFDAALASAPAATRPE